MRCIAPLKASQNPDGHIVYSSKEAIPGLVPFEFPCRKCLACRLNIAREKAVRAYHESKMHQDNTFLTLTYSDAHVGDMRLRYEDFQNFMKDLRLLHNFKKIPMMVTGEYGDKTKRPHWHVLLFNYWPSDAQEWRTTNLDHKVFRSAEIEGIWKKGFAEFGELTMDSASYVARYGAKKLTHGKDQDHDYHPIHKTSSKHAIGKSWIEKYYKHTFENGFVYLPNGEKCAIPRYYQDWCKTNRPELYRYYVEQVRPKVIELSEKKDRQDELEFIENCKTYKGGKSYPKTKSQVKHTILKSKFKRLQKQLKL